jgi:hypothetical protein
MFDDGINVFPNLNSGKMQKFQGFGNLCVRWQPKSGNPYFPFSKTNSPIPHAKEVSVEEERLEGVLPKWDGARVSHPQQPDCRKSARNSTGF